MSPIHPAGTLGFFGLPGHLEMIIILVILLLLFGRRLPEVARSLGDGIREFKKGVQDVTSDASPNQPSQQQGQGNQPAQFTQGTPAQHHPPGQAAGQTAGQASGQGHGQGYQQPAHQQSQAPTQQAAGTQPTSTGSPVQPPAGGDERRVSQDPHPTPATGGGHPSG